MKLTARDQDQQNALAHAFHDRERFVLTGAGLHAEFVAETLNNVPCAFCSGRYETNLELVQVTEATTKAAWNGEGLPPVGTVCEYFGANQYDQWAEVNIFAKWKDLVFVDFVDGWRQERDASRFRPSRTTEQIAAEERENELNRMVTTVSMLDKRWARNVCSGLYDAGYRKQDNTEGWK